MKKLFVFLALLLAGGAASASAETLVIVCPDGTRTRMEIPDASEFPSVERYEAYLDFLIRACCNSVVPDQGKDHWQGPGIHEL